MFRRRQRFPPRDEASFAGRYVVITGYFALGWPFTLRRAGDLVVAMGPPPRCFIFSKIVLAAYTLALLLIMGCAPHDIGLDDY